MWGEEWSPRRELNLHGQVSALRRRLDQIEPGRGGARLMRVGAGYRLALGPGELDVQAFRALAARGRTAARAGLIEQAQELFGAALSWWRGAALEDAAPLCLQLAGEAAQLEEARLAVLEERIGSGNQPAGAAVLVMPTALRASENDVRNARRALRT